MALQPVDFPLFFEKWVNEDGAPFWPYFSHVQGWFDASTARPNILLVHFSRLKADLAGEMKVCCVMQAMLELISCLISVFAI